MCIIVHISAGIQAMQYKQSQQLCDGLAHVSPLWATWIFRWICEIFSGWAMWLSTNITFNVLLKSVLLKAYLPCEPICSKFSLTLNWCASNSCTLIHLHQSDACLHIEKSMNPQANIMSCVVSATQICQQWDGILQLAFDALQEKRGQYRGANGTAFTHQPTI